MSILYLAHGHPRFARGGGELAAYRLFEVIRSRLGFEQTGFGGSTHQGLLPPGCEIMSIDQNEWLISGSSTTHARYDCAVDAGCPRSCLCSANRSRFS